MILHINNLASLEHLFLPIIVVRDGEKAGFNVRIYKYRILGYAKHTQQRIHPQYFK